VADIVGRCFVADSNYHGFPDRKHWYICQKQARSSNPDLASLQPLDQALSVCQCLQAAIDEEADYAAFRMAVRMPAIDFYSGGGGSVLGTSEVFDVQSAVDWDPAACDTLQYVFTGT
jgi:hypothetical protein